MAFGAGSHVTLVGISCLIVFLACITNAVPTDRLRPVAVSAEDHGKPDFHVISNAARLEKREAQQEPVENADDHALDKKSFGGMGASGFHGDTFSNGFGSFSTMKRSPFGGGARGFHGDAFSNGFGEFSTMKKKKFGSGQMDSAFHGRSAFSGGFGDFSTMRKRFMGPSGFHGDTFSQGFGGFSTMKRAQDLPYDTRLNDLTLAALLESIQLAKADRLRASDDEY
ncbi:unnamed protein product [Notodromas monacha]|uniref:Uncharacterized protein n=1 Tax=Notodromas monacha TaxID=399045 RepID=A0A7R9BI46_9CRUS|nr:unnamed protein product [Notodromas monacha]CAG0915634.1 unnamed protein product [Notodromas monacha]